MGFFYRILCIFYENLALRNTYCSTYWHIRSLKLSLGELAVIIFSASLLLYVIIGVYPLNKRMELYYSLPNNHLSKLYWHRSTKVRIGKVCLIALVLIKVLQFSEVFS